MRGLGRLVARAANSTVTGVRTGKLSQSGPRELDLLRRPSPASVPSRLRGSVFYVRLPRHGVSRVIRRPLRWDVAKHPSPEAQKARPPFSLSYVLSLPTPFTPSLSPRPALR
jgi:hypothetical protein